MSQEGMRSELLDYRLTHRLGLRYLVTHVLYTIAKFYQVFPPLIIREETSNEAALQLAPSGFSNCE